MASARKQVLSALDHVAAGLDGLEAPVLHKVIPVLDRAHEEITRELRLWLARQRGGDSFTAQRYRNVLAQLDRGLSLLDASGVMMQGALRDQFKARIGPLSIANLRREWLEFGRIFEGTVHALPLEEMAIIADGKALLWPRFKSSSVKYAAGIGDRARLHLAVSRARSETIDELTNRLQKHLPDVFAGNRWDAERLARTETMNAYNEAHRVGIEHAHAEDPSILARCDATYDFRRCPMCASIDGQVIDRSKGEIYKARWVTVTKRGPRQHHLEIAALPAHPCCRCIETIWRESWAQYSRREDVPEGGYRRAA
jgi:hypothetical protein